MSGHSKGTLVVHTPFEKSFHDHGWRQLFEVTRKGKTLLVCVRADEITVDGKGCVFGDDDARRVAACWNACDGIETGVLEVTHGLNNIYDDILRDKNELLVALKLAHKEILRLHVTEHIASVIAKAEGRS